MTDMTRDGELLSAYLTGDLDDDEVAGLEARLHDDPALAAQLEATRAVLEGLGRLDDVEPPEGFGERLRARLDAERATHETGEASAAPASLSAARTRREARRRRWPALGAVAAGVVGLAMLGALAIGQLGPVSAPEVAMEDAAEEPDADVQEFSEFEATDDDVDRPVAEMDADDAEVAEDAPDDGVAATRSAPDEPLILDSQAALGSAEEATAHLSGSPAEGLLGRPLDEAEDLAAGFAVAIRRAETFRTGTEPSTCLDVVSAGTDQPVVVAQVESVVYEGAEGLAYVTATARSDAQAVDRIEAWIVEPGGCATRLFADLTP